MCIYIYVYIYIYICIYIGLVCPIACIEAADVRVLAWGASDCSRAVVPAGDVVNGSE